MAFDDSDREFLKLSMKNAVLEALQDHRERDHKPLEEQMTLGDAANSASIGRIKGKISWLWGAMAGIALAATVAAWAIETGIEARQAAHEMRAEAHHP